MKRIALVVVLALVAAPAAAKAGATIIEPPESHYPYQQWLDQSQVPTPNLTLQIIEAPCPGLEDFALACTAAAQGTVWVEPAAIHDSIDRPRAVFLHEIGHVFDYVMPLWVRHRFRSLRGSTRPWANTLPKLGLEEVFAESYMSCAMGPSELFAGMTGGAEYDARVCRLIRRAAVI